MAQEVVSVDLVEDMLAQEGVGVDLVVDMVVLAVFVDRNLLVLQTGL